ncbi:MAG: nitronate monooxygenase, partial [Roseburia sp.]|nr:nitronate monooxygenase [Roseburia sp.]
MLKSLKIGDKIAKLPIIQGGMGVGVSLSHLAGAVAAEGGIGVISTAQIGFDEEGFEENQKLCNLRAIEKHVKQAKAQAKGGLVGVNVMVALKDYAQHVQAAVKAGVDVVISGAGLPVNLPELVEGSDAKIAPIVSSEKAANVILR